MPRVNVIQTNFTSGVLSPRVQGRIDVQKYYNGAEEIENFIVLPQGGLIRRPGTMFVAKAKYDDKAVRLVRFQFNVLQAYVLEFGDQYIRFYKDGGQILDGSTIVEVASPYLEAHLFELQFTQSADILYIAHKDYAPRKLMRFSHTDWTLTVIPFLPPPTYEPDFVYSATLTPSATTGTGITFTASSAIFLAGDVSRVIKYRDASAIIRTIGSGTPSTTCTADILATFPTTAAIPAGDWYLDKSPQTTLTPSAAGPDGASITITASANTFVAGDVGRYIAMNGGLLKITGYSSHTQVTCFVYLHLLDTTAMGANLWSLEELCWTDTRGYPSAIGIFQDRMWFAGSESEPLGIWASQTGDYENLAKGSYASSGLAFKMAIGDMNRFQWLLPAKELYMGSMGGEFKIGPTTSGGAITPTSVKCEAETNYGSKGISPQMSGAVIVFVQKSGKLVREFLYSWENDSYVAKDLTLLAENLFQESPIVDMAMQKEPFQRVWMVRDDGAMIVMAYQENSDFYAHSLITSEAGDFESVCVMPSADGTVEELWAVLYTGGERWIVYFDDDLSTDAALTYAGPPAATTVSGLDHLISKTVQIVGDGAVYPEDVVDSVDTNMITDPGFEQWTTTTNLTQWIELILGTGAIACESTEVSEGLYSAHITSVGGAGNYAYVQKTNLTLTAGKWYKIAIKYKGTNCSFRIASGSYYLQDDGSWSSTYNNLPLTDATDWTTYELWFQCKTTYTTYYLTIGNEFVNVDMYVDYVTLQEGTGEITISPSATAIEVGIGYGAKVKTVRPEIQVAGTSQGVLKRWSEIRVRVYESHSLKIEGEVVPVRGRTAIMDTEVPVFSGDIVRNNLGWDVHSQITIEANDPLPCEIIAIMGTVTVSD